jgi:hypothetical protein
VARKRCDADRSVIRHARCGRNCAKPRKGYEMAAVMIGVDPHKGSRTAVAIGVACGAQMRVFFALRGCAAASSR